MCAFAGRGGCAIVLCVALEYVAVLVDQRYYDSPWFATVLPGFICGSQLE